MTTKSQIEWTEQTWNPTTGCTKVSAGCKHCYAEIMAKRLKAMGTNGYQNGFELSLLPERLSQPIKRKKPTTYFVNSMSDLFHEDIPFSFIDKVFKVIKQTPQHRYQILTKRENQLVAYFKDRNVPDNVWLGVSVENIKEGLPRIEILKKIPAKIRFLSIEPLLEDLGEVDFSNIHWVIVGGESGSKARPMEEQWVLNIQEQCDRQNIAFFFKQWGTWGADGVKRNKHKNGKLLNNKIYHNYPKIQQGRLERGINI
ncbi:MAG: phage Gp37/Gp68 family protein [Methylococcales bacterium]|nr:phage Gp37/Gp68 family protein [Methylococcales bacterium]